MDFPHTFAFGLIMYSMVCINNQICPILPSYCEYRYQSDQSTDHGTTVKNVVEYQSSTDDMYLASRDYEVLIVSNYIDTVFINAPSDFRFKLSVLCNTRYGGTVSWNCSN